MPSRHSAVAVAGALAGRATVGIDADDAGDTAFGATGRVVTSPVALDRDAARAVVLEVVRDGEDAVLALDDLVDRAVALLDLLVLAVMRRATPPCPEHMPRVVLAVE